MALDILQGENDCFYGTLQPTFEILMAKILALKEGLSHMMADLPDLIVQVINIQYCLLLIIIIVVLFHVKLLTFL